MRPPYAMRHALCAMKFGMRRSYALLFDAFFFLLIAGAVASAWQWPFATGLFPLTIGIPVLAVALGQLVKDIVVPPKEGGAPGQRIRDIEVDRSVPAHLVVKRAGGFYLCAVGFLGLILLVGFKLAVPIFLGLYLKFLSRAGWLLTLTLMGLMIALVLGVFDNILAVPWPDNLLGYLLGSDPE